jgi:hypothetical protein
LFYGKLTPLKLFWLCSKWSSCPPVRLNKNKGLSLFTGGQYAQDRVGERRGRGHLILKIFKKNGVIEKYVAYSSR